MKLKDEVLHPFVQTSSFNQYACAFERYIEENNLKIIWLASYPRSGNRFLNTLLYFYLLHENNDFSHYSSISYDVHSIGDLLFNDLFTYNIKGQRVIFVKTHFPFNARFPFFSYTYGAIHLYRHPFEVAVSDFIMSEYYSISHDKKLVDVYLKNYFEYFTNFYLSPTRVSPH